MSTGAPRFTFALSASAITYSLTLVGAVVLILGAAWMLIGPATAHAGYLAIMFLLSPARAPGLRMRAAVAGWAVLVATLGFMVGPLGLWPTLIVLVVICVIQGLFTVGEVASLTRSPVNFIAFAGLSHAEAELWQVILGSVIGAVFVVALVAFLTPSILLTVGSEYSASTLGVLRIEAVLAAAVVAIVCSLIFEHIRQRRTMRTARATSDRV